MIAKLTKKVIFFPVRVLSRIYRVMTTATAVPDVLPVGGLSSERASELLFALRHIIKTEQDELVVAQWLTSLQLAQIASDRLLHAIDAADSSLCFWRQRLKQGSHLSFLLLGQGPTSFVLDCVDALRSRLRLGASKQPNATDQIERRVIALRSLREVLCRALAAVQEGATQLDLGEDAAETARALSAAAHQSVSPSQREHLLAQARDAARLCAKRVQMAIEEMQGEAEELTACPPEAGHAENAAALARSAAAAAQTLWGRAARKLQHISGFAAESSAHTGREAEQQRVEPEPPRSEPEDEVARELQRAALHLAFNSSVTHLTSANAALSAAALASRRRKGIILIPEWLAAPSKYKQHWIRYSFIGLAAFWVARFLYLHSPLAGSDDLEEWARSAAESVASAYRDRVLAPILQLKDELFATFRQRRSIVSVGEYETDKASLERMLKDFQADFGAGSSKRVDPEVSAALERTGAGAEVGGENPKKGEGEEGDELLPGMAFMMGCYEDELKRPIRNIVNGSLLRAILIQVQKLKLDTESAMLELDQILRANELTVAVVAAVPSLLIAGGTAYLALRWLTPSPPDRRREALPARMAMVEVERTIQRFAEEGTPEMHGQVIWRVARVYWETHALFRRHSGLGIMGLTVESEWPNLRSDLLELAAPNAPRVKIETCHRMQRVYSLFQP